MDVHHVGIATADAAGLAGLFADLLGTPVVHEERFEGMAVVFLDAGGGYLELLEPETGGGPIARHLDERGPGLHHVAFATDDVAGALDRARNLGIDPVDGSPRAGAWGHEVAFLHPNSTGGVLVELVGEGGADAGPDSDGGTEPGR